MKKNIQIGFTATLMFAASVFISCNNTQPKTGNSEIPEVKIVEEPALERGIDKTDTIIINILDEFIPKGYMGCLNCIDMYPAFTANLRPGRTTCYKIEFQRNCDKNWAGVYWTNVADDEGANWGQYAGRDLSNIESAKITFWARGEKGNEVVEFGSGGVGNAKLPHKDSYKAYSTEGKYVILSKEWKQYTIDLTGKDLSSVIGGFLWCVDRKANPKGVVFYLDDVKLEGYYKKSSEEVTRDRGLGNSGNSGNRCYVLIIGNADYKNGEFPELSNPVNDATGIDEKFKKLGFTTLLIQNANSKRMKQVINDIAIEAKGYDAVMFYYAGHGEQKGDENYLIPIDVNSKKSNCVNVSTVLEKMEESQCNMKIVV